MKKIRYTEGKIAFALKQAETDTRVEEVCRKMGISEATFYSWQKKFGGISVTELRRRQQLEDKTQRLSRLVADLSLDKEMLQDVFRKSSEARPEARSGVLSAGRIPYCSMPCLAFDYAESHGI